MPVTKKDIISRLRNDLLLWEGFKPPAAGKANTIFLGPLEYAFPNGVFPVGTMHEMLCATPEQTAATTGFVTGLLGTLMQQGGACLWIGVAGKLFPPALMLFDVEPHRVIFVDLAQEKEALWAVEEALKCNGLAAVVVELKEISFAQSRRLQLAVESSKVTGIILRKGERKPGATTCVARWQISHLPSEPELELPGVGSPRWQVELLKVRNGHPGTWELEWTGGKFRPVEEKIVEDELQIRKAG